MVVVATEVVVVVFAGAVEVVVVVVVEGETDADVVGFEVAVVCMPGLAEVDVEAPVVVSVLGATETLCAPVVAVVSDGAPVEATASAEVGVASEPLSPSPLPDEQEPTNRIAATQTARMFFCASFLTDFIYDTHLSFLPQRKHRFLSL